MSGPAGVLGGTFDPIHLGHLSVARQCQKQLGLGVVRLVPAFAPPHRALPLAAAEDRLHMARLLVEGQDGVVVDDREVRRKGNSYTVDTLREMRAEEPGRELVLLLGQDAAMDFGSWHEAQAIPGLARLVVFDRAGQPPLNREALDATGFPGDAAIVHVDSPPISATEVRRRLAFGEDVSGMLPASVLRYIRERGLYGARG